MRWCTLTLLGTAQEVFEEIDGDRLIRREICFDIYGEEVVDLTFALILSGKLSGHDLLSSWWVLRNLLLHFGVHRYCSFVMKLQIIDYYRISIGYTRRAIMYPKLA